MERISRAARRIFIRPLWQTLLIAPATFALLIWVLCHDTPPILDHAAYQLSVYGLVITVTTAMRVVPVVRAWLGRNRVINSTFGYLIRQDAAFRAWLVLCLSIAWDLFYAMLKLIVGAALGSNWLRLMGVYYLMLAVVRLIIVRPVGNRPAGAIEPGQSAPEWRRYRLCGALLLLMNLILLAVVVQLVRQKGSFHYPGALIYLMAIYAFWAISNATVKLARYHRRDDPLMSAAKAISLTAAMVSMLSLETALIDRFGDGSRVFHHIITAILGGIICLLQLLLALYMIRRGGEMIVRSRNDMI